MDEQGPEVDVGDGRTGGRWLLACLGLVFLASGVALLVFFPDASSIRFAVPGWVPGVVLVVAGVSMLVTAALDL
ncbi:hypothetical protein [Cellulomonas pakistanensis]|uniref:Uncharacterized protein n=1 Tax=Cellulomonas pakistanensis TaxID=992287 RepID=A0A919P8J4_9CELL|nr:hypothetical protein [Cellulomonas pakistanensis]GIG34955.1 hypothetical protein Cpa01nite_03360 [Cellulomonas pakistanensis]